MATRVERVRVHGYAWGGHRRPTVGRAIEILLPILVIALLTASVSLARSVPSRAVTVPAGAVTGAVSGTPPGLTAAAAGRLEAATAQGGTGYRFTVVQTATLHQREGGEPIPVVDPADPRHVTGTASEAYVTSMISAGAVAPDGFWMEMRRGPTPGQAPDFATSPVVFTVIESPDGLARNDGQGYYATPQSPGMGFDPLTAKAFPRLLASLTKLTDLGPAQVDGATLHGFGGTALREDFPGVVAADGLTFTEATFPIEVWFDANGRLVRVVAHARNLNQDVWDLVLETIVTFDDAPAGVRPAAAPGFDPAAKPAAPASVVTSGVAP